MPGSGFQGWALIARAAVSSSVNGVPQLINNDALADQPAPCSKPFFAATAAPNRASLRYDESPIFRSLRKMWEVHLCYDESARF